MLEKVDDLSDTFVGKSWRNSSSKTYEFLKFIEVTMGYEQGKSLICRIELTTKKKPKEDGMNRYTMLIEDRVTGDILMKSKEMYGYNVNSWPLEMLIKFYLTLQSVD